MDDVSAAPETRMDERGLVELDETIPKTSRIEDGRATLDAKDLTPRKINGELRWLIYEEGITDVTVLNPSARHSLGVAILARCRIRFEGSLETPNRIRGVIRGSVIGGVYPFVMTRP